MSKSPPTSRVVRVLDLLASAETGLTSSAVAEATGISSSTAALILSTLAEAGYVERAADKSYELGPGLLRLFARLEQKYPLLGVARLQLDALAEKLGFGCTLGRIEVRRQVTVLTAGPSDLLNIRPGTEVPIAPPHGTIAMAWRPAAEREAWMADAAMADKEAQRAQRAALENVRQLGYAVYALREEPRWSTAEIFRLFSSMGEEDGSPDRARFLTRLSAMFGTSIHAKSDLESGRDLHVSNIIAPVFGADGQPAYLVTLHVLQNDVPPASLSGYVGDVLGTARILSEHIGGKVPPVSRPVRA